MRLKTRVIIHCDWCGEPFEKWPSKITPKNFCCRECLAAFSSKSKNPDNYVSLKDYTRMSGHFSRLNRKLNPSRMTAETRAKLREYRLGSGEGIAYTKLYGVHEHRIVAERLLGRPLMECEVVNHIDGDKRNNCPDNIHIFPAQSEHAEYHARLTAFFNMQGGDAR